MSSAEETDKDTETDIQSVPKVVKNDFDDDLDKPSHRLRTTTLAKFLLIIFSYSSAFCSMIHFGFWMADVESTLDFEQEYARTPVFSWLRSLIEDRDWLNLNIQKVLIDLGLLAAFIMQHTLLSSRVLKNTRFWYRIHYKYKIDKPLYMITTAIMLQLLLLHWERIPVQIWDAHFGNTTVVHWIHIGAWASMYGTLLMLDLPEMIGLNQVVIESPTVTVKSPEFQMMLQQQRHMGVVPFAIIFLAHPHMTLDRFILTFFLMLYLCRQWSSDFAYDYARDMKQVKKIRLSL